MIIGVVLVLGLIGGIAGVNWYFDRRDETSDSPGTAWTPRSTDRPPTTKVPEPSEPEPSEPETTEPARPTKEPTRTPPRTTSPPTKAPTTRPPTKKPPAKKPVPAHLRPQRGYETVPLPSYGDDLEEASEIARDNSVYGQKVAKTKCSNLPNLYNRPFPALSEKKMRKGLQTMADCVAAMWQKPMAKAGYQATKIKIRTFLEPVRSPCGNSNAGAYYCSANQQIYMGRGMGLGRRGYGYTWAQYFDTMGHEYGHHLQARTGILLAAHWHRSNSSEKDSLVISRRIELQATCFGGMAMKQTGELEGSHFRRVVSLYLGDEVHGTKEHIQGWAIQGYRNREIYQCNTFRAPTKDVR
ncbi:neutral zinc metallopeptidase [Microlunatus sp. GCM10028923]|uniref:neutral zinc metallopeptidase n=1 Tax=Microlunatus sp. GCM10028923 TaxID=3273400 RepID=UPI0036230D11